MIKQCALEIRKEYGKQQQSSGCFFYVSVIQCRICQKIWCRQNCKMYSSILANSVNARRFSMVSLSANGPLLQQNLKNTYLAQQRKYGYQELYLKLFSPDNPPIALAIQVLEGIHDWTGLPWWASIPLTTVIVRSVITLPLAIYTTQNMARLEKLHPEIQQLSKELNKEVSVAKKQFQWDEETAKAQFHVNMKRIVRELYIRDNCHPFKSVVVVLVQLPVWVCMSVGLRNMAGSFAGISIQVISPGLQTEGALWFANMTVPDPTFILPVAFTLTNLLITELSIINAEKPTRVTKAVTYFFRGLSILMLPIAAVMPSCMSYYWMWSSLYGLSQNLLLKSPRLRRILQIPKTEKESTQPYDDILARIKGKFTRKPRT